MDNFFRNSNNVPKSFIQALGLGQSLGMSLDDTYQGLKAAAQYADMSMNDISELYTTCMAVAWCVKKRGQHTCSTDLWSKCCKAYHILYGDSQYRTASYIMGVVTGLDPLWLASL